MSIAAKMFRLGRKRLSLYYSTTLHYISKNEQVCSIIIIPCLGIWHSSQFESIEIFMKDGDCSYWGELPLSPSLRLLDPLYTTWLHFSFELFFLVRKYMQIKDECLILLDWDCFQWFISLRINLHVFRFVDWSHIQECRPGSMWWSAETIPCGISYTNKNDRFKKFCSNFILCLMNNLVKILTKNIMYKCSNNWE